MTEEEYNENVLLENKIPYENFSNLLERNNYIKSFHTVKMMKWLKYLAIIY